MSNHKCDGCPNYQQNPYSGYFECYFRGCEVDTRADERRKFAEWLMKSKYIFVGRDGFTHDFHEKTVSLDEVLAEYEREKNI